jgi:hypothetical protein
MAVNCELCFATIQAAPGKVRVRDGVARHNSECTWSVRSGQSLSIEDGSVGGRRIYRSRQGSCGHVVPHVVCETRVGAVAQASVGVSVPVRLSKRRRGSAVVPKRHQIKHLEFLLP